MMRDRLKTAKRIVIKAGTSILTSGEGRISGKNLARLGRQITALMREHREVALVSSGAIAFGMEAARLPRRPKKMPRLQACAAMGQGKLMRAYDEHFASRGIATAQILLTRDGLEKRNRFLAARHTIDELFRMRVLPIVNENDTVATEEIAFGDNDILSVHVAHMISADLLVLLSDVDGFFLKDGSRIRDVRSAEEIDHHLVEHLRDFKKETTVGGMRAKLEAARVAMRLGVPLAILSGRQDTALTEFFAGRDLGTLFSAKGVSEDARRKWIAFSAARKGAVIVDSGATKPFCVGNAAFFQAALSRSAGILTAGTLWSLKPQMEKSSAAASAGIQTASSPKLREKRRMKFRRSWAINIKTKLCTVMIW